MIHVAKATLFGLLLLSLPASPISEMTLAIDDIVTPAASLKRISATLIPGGAAEIAVGELSVTGRSFNNLKVTCSSFDFSGGAIHCSRGKLAAGATSADLAFTYVLAQKRLDLSIAPSADEQWRVMGNLTGSDWQADVSVKGGQVKYFASLIPESQPRPSKGSVTGQIKASGRGAAISRLDGDLRMSDLALSDVTGLHAAEKLSGSLKLKGDRLGAALRWQADVAYESGEVFWSPVYVPSGGHRLQVRGVLSDEALTVEEGDLRLAGVGDSRFSLEWNLKEGLRAFSGDAVNLDGNGLYTLLLKPFLEKTALDQLTASGKLSAKVAYAQNAVQLVDFVSNDLTLIDSRGRFALEKLNATIPWRVDEETKANIRLGGGKLLGIPLGAFETPVKMHAFDFSIDEVVVPVLDGRLLVNDLRASRQKEDWRWQLSGVLLPVSMEAITKALDVPIMRGVLSATVPRITYDKGEINLGGAIGIRVFDGDVAITDLKVNEPLGRAPRLSGNVEMRNLDLALVTSTFKFGSMEGRIDVDAKDMELSNWKPVKLDVRVASSPGDYRRKISQQAVQNISALGGAGAAAALQRTFLRFFEEFGYQSIGLSCRLRNNVCEMSGVESTPQGYVIVKGGGIPAITVKGYNRYVGWNELLERISRVTQDNSQPIIK